FYQFGMTVAVAVLISLFVAFTIVPMLTARHKAPKEDPASLDPSRARGLWRTWLKIRRVLNIWNRAFDAMKPAYKRMLAFSLRHRWLAILAATAAFAGAIALIAVGAVGTEFMTRTDQGKFYIWTDTPPGTPLRETTERMQELEKKLQDNFDEVIGTFLTVGGENTPVNEATLLVLLKDQAERTMSAQEVVDSARKFAVTVPGINPSLALERGEGGSSKPVEFSIRGENREELARIAHKVQAILNDVEGTVDVDNNLEEGKPELQVDIDRRIADDLGLNIYSISQTVRSMIEGEVVTQYRDVLADEDYDVRIRLSEEFRQSDEAVSRLLVSSGKDVVGREQFLVPLDRVATLSKASAIGEYNRYDRQPDVRVNANVLTGYASGSVTSAAQAIVDSVIQLPPGYVAAPIGAQEFMIESFQNIMKALLLAVIFIYLVLASLYDSFKDPLSIMLSLPLSLVGAIIALAAWESTLSVTSQVGIVMLMGLVTKNAILLVDFIKQRREAGMGRTEAVLDAGPIRLRPILMTTLATVFGMLPLALGLGPGAEFRAPMARAVIGGMISSTLLTLVVVPVVYTYLDDFANFFMGLFRGKKKTQPEAHQVVEQQTQTSQ
ncbi:hypothetical protein GF377_03795, partial [candidate division GN15 bacterium]|nr:hypothetical protein [candidate division GN15 bacterium]